MIRPDRPDAAEIFRTRPEEELERRGDGVASAALVLGPALLLGPVLIFFAPFLLPGNDASWIWVDLACLALSPAVLSLAWRPGGSRGRARAVTIAATILVGLEIGFVGLLANPCAADPTVVGLVAAAGAVLSFLAATATGRQLAREGRLVAPVIAGGLVGFAGFLLSAFWVLPQVLVLCGP